MGSTRIDKNPGGASFRAKLDVAWDDTKIGIPFGVGLDSDGNVVVGEGASGMKGVVCTTQAHAALDVVDVFRIGAELADFTYLADGTTETTAGTNYYADATTGAVSGTDTGIYIGHTVAIDGRNRLVLGITGTPVPEEA